jgi:carbamoyl-phosphate synthase large subunit
MNILVTGAGSLVGHGILRSLRNIEQQDFKVITADPDHRAAGHWLGDHGVTIPLAKDNGFISSLQEIIAQHKVDIVFVGTDPELMKVSESELTATKVVSSPEIIAIGEDKWLTVEFLRQHGFPFPDSALSENRESVHRLLEKYGFPLFAKPRIGARSVGVMKIQGQEELQHFLGQPNYIIQEYLSGEDGEFTAGTMTYDKTCYSSIIFQRDLKDGNTYRAYLYKNLGHEKFITQVSEKLNGVYGPLNFQYRLKNGKPVIFEINSRFSGTTPLRTAAGVNEIEMALEFFKRGKISKHTTVLSDIAILRTWSDIVVPMEQLNEFKERGELTRPSGKYFPFKGNLQK